MESCLYEGVVHHERLQPVNHRFDYRLYMVLLDLAEVPGLRRAGLLSTSRYAPGGFLRQDHFGDARQALTASVCDLVEAQTGVPLDGPIRLLTHLRSFGYYFSPLNLFFCHGSDGNTVQAVVAEVQNTPWLERHTYVLWAGNEERPGTPGTYRHRKNFHVSPFMGLDMDYRWQLRPAGEHLRVGIENISGADLLFRAALQLRRSPLTRRTLGAMQFRHPLMTARMTAAIYLQAFQLWRKQCPYYPHPRHLPELTRTPRAGLPAVQASSTVSAATF
jgi:uncharacterized protein